MFTHDGYREWTQEELDAEPFMPRCDEAGCEHQAGYACADCGRFTCREHAATGRDRWTYCARCQQAYAEASQTAAREGDGSERAMAHENGEYVECEACDGHGFVCERTATGMRLTLACETCDGVGWYIRPAEQSADASPNANIESDDSVNA